MTWLTNFLRSSVGRKQLMALTGLGMAGFLIAHLSGNFLIFMGPEAFNGYADFLHEQKWLPLARIGLIAITVVHLGLAFQLSAENRSARSVEYFYKSDSDATPASQTMIYSGVLILVYLILHLTHFTFGDKSGPDGLYGLVADKLGSPAYGLSYIGAMVILAMHLVHGIQSAFQTLGATSSAHRGNLKKATIGLALAICAGFSTIPVYLMIIKGGA